MNIGRYQLPEQHALFDDEVIVRHLDDWLVPYAQDLCLEPDEKETNLAKIGRLQLQAQQVVLDNKVIVRHLDQWLDPYAQDLLLELDARGSNLVTAFRFFPLCVPVTTQMTSAANRHAQNQETSSASQAHSKPSCPQWSEKIIQDAHHTYKQQPCASVSAVLQDLPGRSRFLEHNVIRPCPRADHFLAQATKSLPHDGGSVQRTHKDGLREFCKCSRGDVVYREDFSVEKCGFDHKGNSSWSSEMSITFILEDGVSKKNNSRRKRS